MKLSDYTLALLADIERRIDPETEEDYREQWKNFWYNQTDVPVFRPERKKVSAPAIELKSFNINDCLKDWELMLDAQLGGVSGSLSNKGAALGIRANYGTGIMTSLFGAEIFEMQREYNTLPTTKPLNDTEKIRGIIEKGMPDLTTGFGKDVLFFGEACAEIFENYPKIKRYVEVYHPDTQGPLDVLDLLWGGEMFCEMYEDPDLVHAGMRLVTDTYKAFMDKWYTIIPIRREMSVHWSLMIRGPILLRLDSGVNMSGEFYTEFSKPYDGELFDYYGGGCMHFCGNGDHFVESLCGIEKMYGINMSQPALNDMEIVLRAVQKNNKRFVGLSRANYYADLPGVRKGIIHG